MTTILLDASVVLAAFDRDDRHHRAAVALLESRSVTLTTIDLARYEVVDVAVRAWRTSSVVEGLLGTIDLIADDGGVIASTRALLGAAARLADEHDLSVYDAAYVAAASHRALSLVSCDVRDLVSRDLAIPPAAV